MMELKSSMNDTWKLLSLCTLLGWLLLLLFFDKSTKKMNVSIARNAMLQLAPFKFYESEIEVSKNKIKSLEMKEKSKEEKKCNMYDGRWVYKPNENPSYDSITCPFLEEKMSCRMNGRPDFYYQHWIWEPTHCDLPMFNGLDMMERLRNKRMIIAGDSLNRNMWESLACLLYTSIPSSRAEVQADSNVYKVLRAKDYNLTLEFYWSPFLIEFDTSHKSGKKVLVLDKLSPNSQRWRGADIMVFNSGHWWVHSGKLKAWDLFQFKNELAEEMEIEKAYKRAMKTWAKWIKNNVDPKKTSVYFRSISAEHTLKKYDQWCYNVTQPMMNKPYVSGYPNTLINIIESVVEEMKQSQVQYLNITKLSEYRIDAHPSIFRSMDWKNLIKKFEHNLSMYADCSHWCLPGLPDTWNRLLYASIISRNCNEILS